MLVEILLFLVGLVLLYVGAEGLVAGSSTIALRFGVKPLVVGLTVVAFGTSSPELLVCVTAAIEHTAATDAISVGNILGSNVANIALILGCASLIRPLEVTDQAVRREYPMMLGASGLLAVLLLFDGGDAVLTRLDGGVLLAGMASYLTYAYISAVYYGDPPPTEEELEEVDEDTDRSLWTHVGQIALGIVGLSGGAYLMVESSVAIADTFGISKTVIGITLVAFGTSLPELATSVVAAFRDEADISVGNVIGSNLFNIMLVLGVVSLMAPITVEPEVITYDIWVMLGVAVMIFPVLEWGESIRWYEGVLLLTFYTGYVVFLFLR